jgi:hypothetical protein
MRSTSVSIVLVLAACGGDGSGAPPDGGPEADARPPEGELYIHMIGGESAGACSSEGCKLATGASTLLDVEYAYSDVVEEAVATGVTSDRADIAAVSVTGGRIRVVGGVTGRTVIHAVGATEDVDGILGDREVTVVDVARERIMVRNVDRPPLADGEPVWALTGSTIPLQLERFDAAGEALLGGTDARWTITGGTGSLAADGETGLVRELHAGAPGASTIAVGTASRALEVLSMAELARIAVRSPWSGLDLDAGDGDTVHVPFPGSLICVVDAFDAAGHYLEGGGPLGFRVTGAGVTSVGGWGRWFFVEPIDQEITIATSTRTMRFTLDFP